MHCIVTSETGDRWILNGDQSEWKLGRGDKSDIQIDSIGVSRLHAKLSFSSHRWWIEDLGSSNCTYVNDEQVDQARALETDDRIRLGFYQLSVELSEASEIESKSAPSSASLADARLFERFKSGDTEAANEIINTYYNRVCKVARRRIKQRRLLGSGSQDIAASVFESLWRKADQGDFDEQALTSGEEFWRLLSAMVKFKTENHVRREMAAKRGGGQIRGESVFLQRNAGEGPGIGGEAGDMLDPSEIAEFRGEYERMMANLSDEHLREIVTLRMEGYKVTEIAEKFGKSDRWVKRKLREIRDQWQEYSNSCEG